ncbi:hypothetical protein F53441_3591 [Fusarium austroafricanum]|uniref:Uncharacterized protein n=1 Tax=Fusarium austroafricanum TaxID=2364996 RepID=A0A8H4NZR6_9HYPO|nr:hypothetical protein F53441_3591 [Fusarium austroafricanum]
MTEDDPERKAQAHIQMAIMHQVGYGVTLGSAEALSHLEAASMNNKVALAIFNQVYAALKPGQQETDTSKAHIMYRNFDVFYDGVAWREASGKEADDFINLGPISMESFNLIPSDKDRRGEFMGPDNEARYSVISGQDGPSSLWTLRNIICKALEARMNSKSRYKENVWNMIVYYGEWLQDESVVMLTSAAGQSQANKDNAWLTVFRNAQGQFMPAMTPSGEASFWRIKKAKTGDGPEISEGNTIKLKWRFKDQASGFRDFYEDSFGRRTFNRPDNVKEDELHLKLPFSGFQKTKDKNLAAGESAGLAMVTSEINHDLSFV